MESTVSIIGGFVTLFGIVYYFFTTRHKERMALLETGADPNLFKHSSKNYQFLLTLGIVSVGLSLGIAVGYILEEGMIARQAQEIAAIRLSRPHYIPSYPAAYLISVFFFVGISLILAYLISQRLNAKTNNNN